ncbi:MAG: homoserine dehydrogenase [Archaeoglobales archaeon]|nr:MAG: homoserine dehydrogenase [Archaeoglobales archaeon]
MMIAIIGFGSVGRGVAEVLMEKRDVLKSYLGDYRVVAVTDSKGGVFDERGLNLKEVLEMKRRGRLPREITSIEVVRDVEFDVCIEVTPTNIEDGEPGLTHIEECLKRGIDVVTSNKGPLVVAFKDLMDLARKKGARLMFEATVGGAMPVVKLAKIDLAGNEIVSVKGILNGTCNYILSRMEKELLPYEIVLEEARELGIAEKDPTYDVEGIDAGAKLVIIANALMGMNAKFRDVERFGITEITPEAFKVALESGYTIRLIAEANRDYLRVSPRLIPVNHPLAIHGTLNALQIETDLAGEVFVIGRGAGSRETASAIISDLVCLSRYSR